MLEKNMNKYISHILCYNSYTIGMTLNEHGWSNVDELIARVNKTHPLDMNGLKSQGMLERVGGTRGYWKVIRQ